MGADPAAVVITHLVDAMGGASDHLWGKEFVVARLMREQRSSGTLQPSLITFSQSRLSSTMSAEGFRVDTLSEERTHGIAGSLSRITRIVERDRPAIIHSHGYRANIIAKALRLMGAFPGVRVISTQHGWVSATPALRVYNTIDRWTTFLSHVTTVPDQKMLTQLNRAGRCQVVSNGVPDLNAAQQRTGRPAQAPLLIVGMLGRVCEAKGVHELLAAASELGDGAISFVVAGDGDLAPLVASAGESVHYLGYVGDSEMFLESIDIFVQASHSEGLSLSLLEAMRAGRAIVATDVGATASAVTHEESALLIPPFDARALRDAIRRLRDDPGLRDRLGRAAEARFQAEFRIQRQHDAFLKLYLDTNAAPAARSASPSQRRESKRG
jgi:glycosyltransferase involved in cell wall biosynthesis